jgi:hypothetical protein
MIQTLQQMARYNVIVSQTALDAAIVDQTALVNQIQCAAIITDAAIDQAVLSISGNHSSMEAAILCHAALDAALASQAKIVSQAQIAAIVTQVALDATLGFYAELDEVLLHCCEI